MTIDRQSTVVGVFETHDRAQQAVNELLRRGFTESQIGMASRQAGSPTTGRAGTMLANSTGDAESTYAGEGTAAGFAAGAGVGALWGLGIIAGVLPVIGPAIAGGTLAAVLTSAAAGAATAGIAGGLVGLGISKDDAEFYDSEVRSGRTLVTVTAGQREIEAREVLGRLGAYDVASRNSGRSIDTVHTGGTTYADPVTGRSHSDTQAKLTGTQWSESGDLGNRMPRR
jgi:hypothetical protein